MVIMMPAVMARLTVSVNIADEMRFDLIRLYTRYL